ncbi:nucleotidyltransferase [Stigmatella sp. ncwal1]|uniref:Nucleotidyltransferase n=1 Tax=Stigmatella ashevillensis TaxID=2995309 RepID=A0ABT5DG79_9BACT|nr:nucleotidyltransferase [Stigmatella ashevillena]MDC0712677.1 nucleotidyltransferase [Stigmatella ashevillena]
MATTVAQAFEKHMQHLELEENKRAKATRQQEWVFDAMRRRLGPKESILSGSYGRNTAIRPLHDIDLFLIFADTSHFRTSPPGEFLVRVQQALELEFPNKQARVQNRSVNIEFSGTGIGFDVVPAVEDARHAGWYWIPDKRMGQWIRSDPRKHLEACNEANDHAKKKLKPLIKAIKRWNSHQEKRARSFHFEALAYQTESLMLAEASYSTGLTRLFQFMEERMTQPCEDPAKLGPPIDTGVSEGDRQQIQQQLRHATRRAEQALVLERQGDMFAAIEIWQGLLGPDFQSERRPCQDNT